MDELTVDAIDARDAAGASTVGVGVEAGMIGSETPLAAPASKLNMSGAISAPSAGGEPKSSKSPLEETPGAGAGAVGPPVRSRRSELIVPAACIRTLA